MPNRSQTKRYRVGYALSPRNEQSCIQPSLLTHAHQNGLDLIPIDPNKSLIEQGPFNCIIHKLYGQDWTDKLQQFSSSQNPNFAVPIIDSPESIKRLHSRISMLEAVNHLKLEKVSIPKQAFVLELEDMESLEGLKFPVIAKPVIANGNAESHMMHLIFDMSGYQTLMMTTKLPIVLQEFVNHGGVVFKVYVVGSYVKCVKRRSLPDISEEKMKSLKGYLSFSDISSLCSSDDDEQEKKSDEVIDLERVELPCESFVVDVAHGLREAMGLNLFNFDLIRDGDKYFVIDINYFPGYAKMPGYESVLTDFLLECCQEQELKHGYCYNSGA